jgi:inward rectifier potassium channel
MANGQIRERLTSALREATGGAGKKAQRPRVRSFGPRQVIAEGIERNFRIDFYHNAMTVTWPTFFGVLAAAFVALNSVFAVLYWLGDAPIANAKPGSFADLFFFSVETTSTVGYGDMHPQTIYGHLVATAENFVGLVLLAVMTGMVFSRFSRPRARLIYARNPVISRHNGLPTLTFRLANARNSFISEATAKLWMLGPSENAEGKRYIGFQPMRLTKYENPMFGFSWTLFHPIDADSPIYGLSYEDLLVSEILFVVSINGLDETSAQIIHSRESFAAQDVLPEHEFVDMFSVDEDGLRHIDYSKVHETRPLDAYNEIVK